MSDEAKKVIETIKKGELPPLSSNSTEFESQNAMATIPADIPELPLFSYRILLFGIRAIDAKRLKNHIGRLSDETMAELDKKLKYALGL